jgi:putative endonuclease
MIKGEKRKLGFWGERRAAAYLKRQGYKIVKRNYKCPYGEVDIIAQKGDVVCFVEVKTRSSEAFGLPNEAVDRQRRQRYMRCVKYFFCGRQIDVTVRFDIIELLRGDINFIQNAFAGGAF